MPLRPKRLRFSQPLPCVGGVGVIEVSDCRFRERPEKHRHVALPLFISDHCHPFDVGEVLDVKL